MTASPTILRDLLFDEWSLIGDLGKTGTQDDPEVVNFFDRLQVQGNEQSKAITIQKINQEANQGIIQHPHFTEVSDLYEIVLYHRILNTDVSPYSTFLDNIEKMGNEVTRILETTYSPANNIGIFFKVSRNWINEDLFEGHQPELRRRLFLRLTSIISENPEVFSGFKGILVFDTSKSEGDLKPPSDFLYTEVDRVILDEGYEEIPILTKDKVKDSNEVDIPGVPHYFRGQFSGTFSCEMKAKKSDLQGTTIEKITNIYKAQKNSPIKNQIAQVALLQSTQNTETTPKTFDTTSFMKITRIQKNSSDINLVSYIVIGQLTKPSEYAFGVVP